MPTPAWAEGAERARLWWVGAGPVAAPAASSSEVHPPHPTMVFWPGISHAHAPETRREQAGGEQGEARDTAPSVPVSI